MRFATHLALALALAITSSCADAARAATEPAERPQVGLALSGGGARGFAHIGVIRRLEELRVPVDRVAGVSMGALIGALYATGHDAAETEALARKFDWNRLLRTLPPYSDLTFRRKQDRRSFPNELELGLRGGNLASRPGLGSGHAIGLYLDRLTLPYTDALRFDDLPIPFRCIAADLELATEVALDEGSLSTALSATMAVPGFLPPVLRQGRLLGDGGLLNNLPVDTARAMGAELIIAVDIGTPLVGRDKLGSLGSVVEQAVGIMTVARVRRNRELAEILLEPDLDGVSVLDFAAIDRLIELGYASAVAATPALEQLSLSPEDWTEHLAARRARRRVELPMPGSVVVHSVPAAAGRDVAPRVLALASGPNRFDQLEMDLNRLAGAGRFSRVGYGVMPPKEPTANDPDGASIAAAPTLVIRVEEKAYGPPFLLAGIEVHNTGADRVDFVLRSRLLHLDVGAPGAELSVDGWIGSNRGARLEYYRPILDGPAFAAIEASYENRLEDLYDGGRQIAQTRNRRAGFAIAVGRELGRRAEVRLGAGLADIDTDIELGDVALDADDGLLGTLSAAFRVESLDRPTVPRRGVRLEARGTRYFRTPSGQPTTQLEAEATTFHPINARTSAFLLGLLGTSLKTPIDRPLELTLGGPLRLGGLGRAELRGAHVVYGGAGVRRLLTRLPTVIGDGLYGIALYELGSAFDDADATDYRHGATAGIVLETRLGPVFVGSGWTEGGGTRLVAAIGPLF